MEKEFQNLCYDYPLLKKKFKIIFFVIIGLGTVHHSWWIIFEFLKKKKLNIECHTWWDEFFDMHFTMNYFYIYNKRKNK